MEYRSSVRVSRSRTPARRLIDRDVNSTMLKRSDEQRDQRDEVSGMVAVHMTGSRRT